MIAIRGIRLSFQYYVSIYENIPFIVKEIIARASIFQKIVGGIFARNLLRQNGGKGAGKRITGTAADG
jgi:hypothetical protein